MQPWCGSAARTSTVYGAGSAIGCWVRKWTGKYASDSLSARHSKPAQITRSIVRALTNVTFVVAGDTNSEPAGAHQADVSWTRGAPDHFAVDLPFPLIR